MNMQGLLKQAQKMQKELTKLEDELNEKELTQEEAVLDLFGQENIIITEE